MKLTVHLTPDGLAAGEFRGVPVIVIDILRSGTTIAAAIAAGAKAIYPAVSTDDALRLKRDLGEEEVLLAGERRTLPQPGFDLGNSPREMTAARVKDRRIVMATTNGTPALARAVGAPAVLVGSAVGFSATEQRARRLLEDHGHLAIVCAGREGRVAIEDGFAAGRFVLALKGRRRTVTLNDGAQVAVAVAEKWGKDWSKVLDRCEAAATLRDTGLGDDLAVAATTDLYGVVPELHDGVIR